jgi:dipeptidyl aminopeptidase/acylaminoacyl peptidase
MIPTPAGSIANTRLMPPRPSGGRALDLETLFFARRIISLEWSADSRDIFFETNVTGRFNIWRVPADGGWPVQITVAEQRTALWPPSPDGRWLLYTQDRDGNEKPNLFLIPPAGGPARRLTATEGIGYRSLRWSPDGRTVACAAELAGPGTYEVYRIDPGTAGVVRIAGHESGECELLRWSPDGRRLALARTRDYMHSGISVLDLETGSERTLIPIAEAASSSAWGWTGDGESLIISSNANAHGTEAVALLPVADPTPVWLTLETWDTEPAAIAPAGEQLVYTRNESGRHRVFLRHLKGGQVEIPLPPGVLVAARFSPDGRCVALLHTSATSPSEIWTYEIHAGTLRRISDSLAGGLAPGDFVEPQLVAYPSFDGTPIAAFVYLPPGLRPDGAHPAVVVPHGGPTAQYMNTWAPRVQYLVSRGFVVIAPNFRGSTGFGRAFQEANRRDLGGGDLRDVMAAAEFLAASGYVDRRRVAIMGGSYGGYLTLMALATYPDRWTAGVAIVPFANWFTEYEHEDPTLKNYDRMMMGDPVADEALWRERSPIFFADRIRAPLLILAGANDIRCPPGEARQVAEAVRRAGGKADLHIYENEGHGFMRRENDLDAFRRAAAFLEAACRPA